MIELRCTREEILEEIEASPRAFRDPLTSPEDPGFSDRDEVSLRLLVRRRRDVLAPLQAAFSKRYSAVPAEALDRDLLRLLKKGLGNAFKHGAGSAETPVEVEVIATCKGALVEIRDAGPGFDVEAAIRGFRRDRRYFQNKGSGLRTFERARSRVSWANEGRTLLLGFCCDPAESEADEPYGSAGLPASLRDPEQVLSIITGSIRNFRQGNWSARSCDVTALRGGAGAPSEFTCTVKYTKRGSPKERERTWTGRVLSQAASRVDLAVSGQLKREPLGGRGGLAVPKASDASAWHAGLLLHKVDATMDLHAYLDGAPEAELRETLKRVGRGLWDLHERRLELEGRESRDEALAAGARRVEGLLPRLVDAGVADPALREALAKPPSAASWPDRPIHGGMGWDALVHDGGLLHLWHFERARVGHPGFDLGGFLADLALSPHPDELAAEFERAYFGEAEPAWREDLPFFIAAAGVERLERMLDRGVEPAALAAAARRIAESVRRAEVHR